MSGYNRIFFVSVPTIMWLLFNIGIDSMLGIQNHFYSKEKMLTDGKSNEIPKAN